MLSTVFEVVVMLLGAVGLATVFGWAVTWFDRPEQVGCLHVLPVRGDSERLEQLLRWSYNCLCRERWPRRGRLLLLDLGADEQQRQVMEAFARERGGVTVCGTDGLAAELADDTVYKILRIVLY